MSKAALFAALLIAAVPSFASAQTVGPFDPMSGLRQAVAPSLPPNAQAMPAQPQFGAPSNAPMSQAPQEIMPFEQIPPPTAVICAGNIPPAGTVITAAGTSTVCWGSCRARQIEAVQGSNMVICAHQPIPQGYALAGITTSPDCACLGDQDNAYMITLKTNPADGSPLNRLTQPQPWQPSTQLIPFRSPR